LRPLNGQKALKMVKEELKIEVGFLEQKQLWGGYGKKQEVTRRKYWVLV